MIQLSGQAESVIRSIADLRAQIASEEVHIQELRTFATEQNPEEIEAQERVKALQNQLTKLEREPNNEQALYPVFAAGKVPAVSLEYAKNCGI